MIDIDLLRPKMLCGYLAAIAGRTCYLIADSDQGSDLLSIAMIASGAILSLTGVALIYNDIQEQKVERQARGHVDNLQAERHQRRHHIMQL